MEYFLIWLILVLAVNAGFSWIVGYIASQKGRSFGGFFALSFFLSFLVGILAVIAIPRKETPLGAGTSSQFVQTNDGEKAKCPFCSEWVKSEAKVCKHCGREIESELSKIRAQELKSREQAELEYISHLEATKLETQQQLQLKKQKNSDFLKSKKGKITLLSIATVAIIAVVFGAIQFFDFSIKQQQAAESEKAYKENLVSDCSLITQRLDQFKAITSVDLNTNLLPSTPALRESIKKEITTAIPGLIEADAHEATRERNIELEGGYDWEGPAQELARRTLYNQVIENTSYSPAAIAGESLESSVFEIPFVEECVELLADELDELELAKERMYIEDEFDKAGRLGIAARVIRSCDTRGYYLNGIPCS